MLSLKIKSNRTDVIHKRNKVLYISRFSHTEIVISIKLGSLKLYDLLQMYEVHEAYQKSIAEDVMKQRALNISEISANYDVRDAFKYLGAFTPEVIIKQSDIQYKDDQYSCTEEIIRLIDKRCSKGHLKKVTIVFDSHETNANDFRTEMPESVLAIESLTIDGITMQKDVKCDAFLQAFKAKKWLSITLKNMDSPENCLKVLNYDGVHELSIVNCNLRCGQFWTEFFQKRIGSLESLTWDNVLARGSLTIGPVDMTEVFPALKRLHLDARCLEFSKFVNLQRLDLHKLDMFGGGTFRVTNPLLNSVTSIEELSIIKPQRSQSFDAIKSIWLRMMKLMVNLRKVKIDYVNMSGGDFVQLVEQIPRVSEIHLIGTAVLPQKHIQSLVKMANLRSLKLQVPIKSSEKMFRSLATYRKEWHNNSLPIDIYILEPNIAFLERLRLEVANHGYNNDTKINHIRLHSLKIS